MSTTRSESYLFTEWKCGGCRFTSTNLADFFFHLIHHSEGGNFFFDYSKKTAFPKYCGVTCDTQTEGSIGTSLKQLNTRVAKIVDDELKFETVKLEPIDDECSDEHLVNLNSFSAKHQSWANIEFLQNKKIRNRKDDPENIRYVESSMNDDGVNSKTLQSHSSELSNANSAGGFDLQSYSNHHDDSNEDSHDDAVDSYIEMLLGKNGGDIASLVNGKQTDFTTDHKSNDTFYKECEVTSKNNFTRKSKPSQSKREHHTQETVPDISKRLKKRSDELLVEKKNIECKMKDAPRKQGPRTIKSGYSKNKQLYRTSKCHLCLEQYEKIFSLYEHIETIHDGDYNWKCNSCHIPFLFESEKQNHMEWCDKSGVKSHACLKCDNNKLFLSRKRLISHINQYHGGVLPLSCDECGQQLASEYDQRAHKTAHNPKLLRCLNCGQMFKKLYEFDLHSMGHKGRTSSTCYICNTELCHIYQARNHMHTHLDNESVELVCECCGITKYNKKQMDLHQAICKRLFTCAICEKSFCRKYALTEHMLLHDDQTFICDQCGVKFKCKKSLARHIKKAHFDSPKSFQCSECQKSFTSNISYRRHCLIHKNAFPYACQECGKRFRTRWNLSTHQRQHTGEKPYACGKCGLGFAHNVVRKTHESKCTNNNINNTIAYTAQYIS